MRVLAVFVATVVLTATATPWAQSDLDRLMAQVLARRDANWKKLQQYTLQEEQVVRVTGPLAMPLFGTKREYIWVPREGFFVRSPLRADGVTIGEAERRREEDAFLERERERERRRTATRGTPVDPSAAEPVEVQDIISQSLEPQFVSAAYFMNFRFESGTYALVGREELLGRTVLRIEYYPERLFRDDRRRGGRGADRRSDEDRAALLRQMNKVSLVTLWVEPAERQILQYEFSNVDADFLPARWLARLDDARASMRMGTPFPDVWLPASMSFQIRMTLAVGVVQASYDVTYHDHRLAETSVKIVP